MPVIESVVFMLDKFFIGVKRICSISFFICFHAELSPLKTHTHTHILNTYVAHSYSICRAHRATPV